MRLFSHYRQRYLLDSSHTLDASFYLWNYSLWHSVSVYFNAAVFHYAIYRQRRYASGLVFWTMGSLNRASWDKLHFIVVLVIIFPCH